MAEDTKQPGSETPTTPDASTSDSSGTPSPSSIPDAGQLAGADAEKKAMVDQAKSRVAAVKEGLTPPAGAPKPPVKKKEEGPKPTDASSHPLVKKLKTKIQRSPIESFKGFKQYPWAIMVVTPAIKNMTDPSVIDFIVSPFIYSL